MSHAALSTMRRLGEVDAIVFWRLDRLSRSVLDFSKIIMAVLQGIDVSKATTNGRIDPDRAQLVWRT